MQHQVANLAGSLDGSDADAGRGGRRGAEQRRHERRGAADAPVPGHGVDRFARFNSAAVFRDNVQSYSTVEPAIDLTATSPLAFARQAAARADARP